MFNGFLWNHTWKIILIDLYSHVAERVDSNQMQIEVYFLSVNYVTDVT